MVIEDEGIIKHLVTFTDNPDGISVTMKIDYFIVDKDIQYVPERLVDGRGVALYLYCKQNNINWDHLRFIEMTEQEKETLKRHYIYMKDPINIINNLVDSENPFVHKKKVITIKRH